VFRWIESFPPGIHLNTSLILIASTTGDEIGLGMRVLELECKFIDEGMVIRERNAPDLKIFNRSSFIDIALSKVPDLDRIICIIPADRLMSTIVFRRESCASDDMERYAKSFTV